MQTWAEVYDAVPANPFDASRKDERDLTEAFEDFVGGPGRGLMLMRIYGNISSNRPETVEKDFIAAAQRCGFTEEQAKSYLSMR